MPRLQTGLALAIREGLTPAQALASVTTTPAEIAGRQQQVGSLVLASDADLIVWSGQPWDLRSRILLVVQNGRIVHETKSEDTAKENAR